MPRVQTLPYFDPTTIITNFRVNGKEPPLEAMPLVEAPPVIIRPQPTALYGAGRPCRAVGPAAIECGRDWITAEGIDWWMSFFAEQEADPYVQVTVRGFDPLYYGWVEKGASMWLPFFDPIARGGYRFRNFRVRFTGIYL